MKAKFVLESLNEQDDDMLIQETPPEYSDGEDFQDDDLVMQDEFETALRNELSVPEFSRRAVSFRLKGDDEIIEAIPMKQMSDTLYLMKVGDKYKKFDINNIIEESFNGPRKKKINEGSVDEFMMNYGSEIQDSLKILKEVGSLMNNNQRRALGGGENFGEKYEQVMDKLYNIYDERVVDWIEGSLGPNSYASGFELAKMAADNQDSTGTEMRMVLNAIEDLGGAFGIYPGMEDDDE